jgi:FAD/FMN-containing dehydrogenase
VAGGNSHQVGLTRRRLLQAGALAAGAAYGPALDGVAVAGSLAAPPAFPSGIPVRRRAFHNWAGSIDVRGLWTARPADARQLVDIVNWAHANGWKVRPKGAMHGWSPFTVLRDTKRSERIVLVDTRDLHGLELASPTTVRAGAGAALDDVYDFLHARGLGLTSIPATGAPTVGGALAIGGHGAALPAAGEPAAEGHGFGSLSNQVVELEAVVWSAAAGQYVLRTFDRKDPVTKALLVHIGRAFLTSATLRCGAAQQLRCVSHVDIPGAELFAAPGSPGRLFGDLVEEAGRVESIWFPFTEKPWLKVWSVAPEKPASSRAVTGPYNYPFSDRIPKPVAKLADRIIRGEGSATPQFAQTEYTFASAGLSATNSMDIWGAWKDTLRYIRASTLRVDECGICVLCRRADLQRVLHLYASKWIEVLETYRARGSYPLNGPLEMRACGIDDPAVSGVAGAAAPAIAATAPRRDRPDWDTVVWANVLTFPYTDDCFVAYRDIEQWAHATFDGTWAGTRVEWSKGWAFTPDAAFADRRLLRKGIPATVSAGRNAEEDWSWAMRRLNGLDPHRVFGNAFLDDFARP